MRKSKDQSELPDLIRLTQQGDEKAFTELVRRYQSLAYATAYSVLGDGEAARDAVQDSFLTVFARLRTLKSPKAFSSWLRSIVRYSSYRILRRIDRDGRISEEMATDSAVFVDTDRLQERQEREQLVQTALHRLPEELREIVMLFYIEEHTQGQIAEFLGTSRSTINNRLYSARQILKRRMLAMVEDTLKGRKLPDDFAENMGRIVRVQGMVVDAALDSGAGASLFDNWTLAGEDRKGPLLTVIQRDREGHIRLLSNGEHKSLRSGSKIMETVENDSPPSADRFIADAVTAISPREYHGSQLLETGIKVIDLLMPLPTRGSVGLLGTQGIGRAILVMELYHRLKKRDGHLAVFYFVSRQEAVNLKAMIEREPNFPPDSSGSLETAWLVTAVAVDPHFARSNDILDTAIYFSPLLSCRDLYPAIDSRYSSSRLLNADFVSEDHLETTERIHDLLQKARRIDYDPQFCEYVAMGAYDSARKHYHERSRKSTEGLSPSDRMTLMRARKLELFLTQPFYTTESFTKIPGLSVSLADTVAGCRAILDGEVDGIPSEAFGFAGTIDDVRRRAAT